MARFAPLTFTSQKNGVRGEVINLACSGDPYLCPVQASISRVLSTIALSPPSTPLARMFNTPANVTATFLIDRIREAITALCPDLGFLPSDVSARCLRAAGGTALLLAPKSVRTSSASSASGARTKCSAIYTSKLIHS